MMNENERFPITHEVKSWPAQFDEVANGTKTFEIRKNDRDYRVGDFIRIHRWDNEEQKYTGTSMLLQIVGITTREDLRNWIELGDFVIISFQMASGYFMNEKPE